MNQLNAEIRRVVDGISNTAFKHLPLDFLPLLTNLYNSIFKVQYFPQALKTAAVVPIPKLGKEPTLPQNYRPISLHPTLGKVTENIFLTALP